MPTACGADQRDWQSPAQFFLFLRLPMLTQVKENREPDIKGKLQLHGFDYFSKLLMTVLQGDGGRARY
eukprot:9481895-Pyramimonas_sp.AAC.1